MLLEKLLLSNQTLIFFIFILLCIPVLSKESDGNTEFCPNPQPLNGYRYSSVPVVSLIAFQLICCLCETNQAEVP